MISRRLLFAGLTTLFLATACSKPEPPELTPKEAQVTGIGTSGLSLLVRMEALNPNRITLSAQSFTGKVKLDGKWDLGSVTISKPVVLPPKVPTMIDIPMTLPLRDVKALGALATSTGPVPYVIEGTATIGGENVHVDVPFTLSGTITREQATEAALKSLPAIPGLNIPGLTPPPP